MPAIVGGTASPANRLTHRALQTDGPDGGKLPNQGGFDARRRPHRDRDRRSARPGRGVRREPGQRDVLVRENIERVEWKTPRPLAVGSRLAIVARFLGRRLDVYGICELVPGERLVVSTADGPFEMETTYTWANTPSRSTAMTLRNRGDPSGFARVGAPIMERAMRRANRKDLAQLKQILETRAD